MDVDNTPETSSFFSRTIGENIISDAIITAVPHEVRFSPRNDHGPESSTIDLGIAQKHYRNDDGARDSGSDFSEAKKQQI